MGTSNGHMTMLRRRAHPMEAAAHLLGAPAGALVAPVGAGALRVA